MRLRTSENDVLIKICILFHPSGPFSKYIPKLIENFEGETLPTGFSFLGIKVSAFKLLFGLQPIKFLLLHTINQDFYKKLFPYYSGSSGALIIFSRDIPDSYEAAKHFFQFFRTLTVNPHIPVTFIDILPQSEEILVEEAEQLDPSVREVYFTIQDNDFPAFIRIFESFISDVIIFAHQQSV